MQIYYHFMHIIHKTDQPTGRRPKGYQAGLSAFMAMSLRLLRHFTQNTRRCRSFPINKVISGWRVSSVLSSVFFSFRGFLWEIRFVFNVKLTLFYRHLIFPDEWTHSVVCTSIGRHPFLGGIKLNVAELSQKMATNTTARPIMED